jgi:hypothetical protein
VKKRLQNKPAIPFHERSDIMKRNLLMGLVGIVVLLFCVSVTYGAEVAEGKVLKIEKDGTLVTIEEYDINFSKEYPYGHPTGVQSVYSLSNALIGMTPAVGDILRIAYEVKGKERMAVRVMNITKQDLMKK